MRFLGSGAQTVGVLLVVADLVAELFSPVVVAQVVDPQQHDQLTGDAR